MGSAARKRIASYLYASRARRAHHCATSQKRPGNRTDEQAAKRCWVKVNGGNMRYPIAIEPGDESHAYGVVVPDLPGCFSAGDTIDEAIDNAQEAIELWLETVIDEGGALPEPKTIGEHQANPEYAGWVWAIVTIDLSQLSDKVERVNITLPARVLRRIDADAKAAGESRSGFIAHRVLVRSINIVTRKKITLKKSKEKRIAYR